VGLDPTGLTYRPATEAEVAQGPEPFAPLAAAFERIGFHRAGAVVEDVSPDGLDALVEGYEPSAAAGFRRWTGVPSTALASPDGTTLGVVGWFWDTPVIDLTSILADGRPVSTRSPWQVDPPWPVAIQRYWKFTDRRTEQLYDDLPGRSIEIVDGVDPADLWAAHQGHLARVAGAPTPIGVADYCAMRNVAHEVLWRNTARMNRFAGGLTLAAVVVAAALAWVVGVMADAWWFGLALGSLVLLLLMPVSTRLSWAVRHVRRLRPPYPLPPPA
jgi:hypothetical protein